MTPTPKQPISEKRLAANRANAARSTGPCTEEGKTRSAQNARKHGFTAAKFVVDGLEDSETLDNLRADAIAVYRPANSQELFAVERIVLAQQSMLRCFALEAGLHSAALTTPGVDPNLCLAIGFIQEAANWRLFLRYQAQAERQYRRAVEELERLQTLRAQLPNEPTVAAEVEETTGLDVLPLITPNPPAHPARSAPATDHLAGPAPTTKTAAPRAA